MSFANFKTKFMTAGLAILAVATVGCSNQWREANFEVDEQALEGYFTEMSTSGRGGSSEFFKLYKDENTVVFFSHANAQFGPVASVFSIIDYSFLGSSFAKLYFDDMADATIAFVYQKGTGACSLMIDVIPNENVGLQTDTKFFDCSNSYFENGGFVAILKDASGSGSEISLRSFDVTGGFFKPVIQLQLSVLQNGQEIPNGKFSTLVGFGL